MEYEEINSSVVTIAESAIVSLNDKYLVEACVVTTLVEAVGRMREGAGYHYWGQSSTTGRGTPMEEILCWRLRGGYSCRRLQLMFLKLRSPQTGVAQECENTTHTDLVFDSADRRAPAWTDRVVFEEDPAGGRTISRYR